MERERWEKLYCLAVELGRGFSQGHRYSVAFIVGVFMWACIHDRPTAWACQARHWPADLRIGRLPSQATMSRRLKSLPVLRLLKVMEAKLADQESPADVKSIDAKPLPVGGASKDPDAHWGRGAGGLAKGYKFYCIWGRRALPEAWSLRAMNVPERAVARQLISHLSETGWLLGDGEYDASALYDLAAERGHQLLARRPAGRHGSGLGHHYQSPHRLTSIQFIERGGESTYRRLRAVIERRYANLTSFASGLGPLPAWVRRFDRVFLWVQTKLLINAQRILDLDQRKLASA